MATEAQRRAVEKYNRTHVIQIVLKLNRTTDADIIERLDTMDSKQGYIKRLIREDMKGRE